MTSINERITELRMNPEDAKARTLAQVAAIRERQQAAARGEREPGANFDIVFAALMKAMPRAEEQIADSTPSRAYMMGFVKGWIYAEGYHGYGVPEDASEAIKAMDIKPDDQQHAGEDDVL